MRDLPQAAQFLAVRNGQVYYNAPDTEWKVVLGALPVQSGAPRTLVRALPVSVPTAELVIAAFPPVTITERAFFYVIAETSPPPRPVLPPDQAGKSATVGGRAGPLYSVYRAPLSGGSPARIVGPLPQLPVILGESACWLERTPGTRTFGLMEARLDGGKPRLTRTGVSSNWQVSRHRGTLGWLIAQSRSRTSLLYRRLDGAFVTIPDYPAASELPFEYQGQLCWLARRLDTGALVLSSTDRQGAGRRDVAVLEGRSALTADSETPTLEGAGGRLYFLGDDRGPGARNADRSQMRDSVYGLAPDGRATRLSRLPWPRNGLSRLVGTLQDGPFLYFFTTEEHDNWLDWSQAGLMRRTSAGLYRIRLPG